MHAPGSSAEMDEEVFQILFDIMEEHFAALKIPSDSEPENKLTRTLSFSELQSARRVFIQHCYTANDSNLVKQFSCEQIFDRNTHISQIKFSELVRAGNNEHVKSWNSTVPYRNNLKTPNWRTDSNTDVIPLHTSIDNQIEYMEVDDVESNNQLATASIASSEKPLSSKSNADFAKPIFHQRHAENKSSDCVNENERINKLKKYQEIRNSMRSLVKRPVKMETQNRNHSSIFFAFIFLVLLSIAIVLISIHLYQYPKHSNDFNTAVIELKRRIHGHDHAIQDLSEYLLLDMPLLKVIALVGGTGIGKSYTVDIIKKNFPTPNAVHQYFPPIALTLSDVKLSLLSSNLIILENLKEHNAMDVVNFLKTYQGSDTQYITVLTVFNVEQMDDDLKRNIDLNQSLMTIKNVFFSENIDAKVISYDSLNEDSLEKCIMDAARDSDLILSDSQIELVKQNLLINNAGCKGAYSKVQVIGRQ